MTKPSLAPYYRELENYTEPTLFFISVPDASQSIVYSYVKGDAVPDLPSRYASLMFSVYFGGGMSSLMFQEIREFRSFAYRTSGRYQLSPYALKDKPGCFTTMLSTQSDKTVDAISVLNELILNMPEKPERMDAVKQILRNKIHNDYPSFRHISEKVAALQMEGYTEDPGKAFLEAMDQMDMEDIKAFYEKHIKGRPIVYVISGNPKRINMKELAKFGQVIKVNKKDIYR